MSNIINLTWNGATDDNGISGYQIQWRTSTTSPWSQPILVNHNPNSPGNNLISGGGSYSHTITQVRDHTFRIRIIDSVGQFSGYKEISVPVDSSTILISSQGIALGNNLVCTSNALNPINPILLKDNGVITSTITDTLTFVKNVDDSTFDGQNRFWRILLNTISYKCKIEPSGKIVSHEQCSSNIRTFNISSQGYDSNITNGQICVADLNNTIYFNNELQIGTIVYNTLNDNGTLSGPFIGINRYYLISDNDFYYIIQIQNNGSVSSIQDYTAVCQLDDPNNVIVTCCFVKGTKITMFDYTTKNIEDVKIGDIVITYNEETKLQEPGEVTNIANPVKSNIVEYELSNGVLIKSTTCHPYWVVNKGWSSFNKSLTKELYDFNVEQIEESDVLLTIDNKEVVVDKITELITKEVATYNLEILGNHTYYANGILVHNKTAVPPAPNRYDEFGNQTSAWTTWNNLYGTTATCYAEP